ncbi:hypothetical protein DESUT3_20550 [Desulfuromonas versatilis]|uniref:Cytochrome c domain-containing protein n=1 Tax=Desulfuromonas versatilis TaxID=2802975 RepID=A0ABN6DYE8_9BACT|nr:c-type cytochrome [Desulfuromonas versatilis]BCR04986.1 hypothetical protein DESUT3_20550 [Desulfuromonas versatilis]
MKPLGCLLVLSALLVCGAVHPRTINAAEEQGQAAGAPSYDLKTGESVYQKACMACHSMGVAGAPRYGKAEDWKSRIDKGMEVLVRNSLEGFQGEKGLMPARGGRSDLSDEEVAAAVAYMVEGSR